MASRLSAALGFAGLMLASAAGWPNSTTEGEVEYLLEFVAASGCIFIRNDEEHSSEEAADHLRLKYSRGKRYVDTAEDFIDRLATESSWTGRAYTVRCGEQEQSSAAWLHRALTDRRESSGDS